MLNLGTIKPVAKVVHRCENCGGRIEVGQVYIRARIVDGGDAWVWKSHAYCQRASEILFNAGVDGDDGTLPLVMDMDREDQEVIREADAELADRIWPEVRDGVRDD